MGKSKKSRDHASPASSRENTPVKKKMKDSSDEPRDQSAGQVKLTDSHDECMLLEPRAGSSASSTDAPQWFIQFEARQEARFSEVLDKCKEAHDAINMSIEDVKEDLKKVRKELKDTVAKMDDLENRNRRNNIVIFNLPEGTEGSSCSDYIQAMLRENCNIEASIERAHRSGRPGGDKPRPIHVAFSFFPEKEKCRKALSQLYRQKKFGSAKLFVSNDFSKKVQDMRKEKIPEIKRLKELGHQAFLIYPATVKIRDALGRVRDP